jgi:hypothetical protein
MAVEEDDWRKPFFDYFNHGILLNDHVERHCLQQRLTSYILKAGVLYQRSFGQEVLSRCVSRKEANQILLEMHKVLCGGHQSGAKMYHSIKLVGYYWPELWLIASRLLSLVIISKFMIMSNICHQFLSILGSRHGHLMLGGIDFIGAIEPPSARGHHFILAVTDYFSKWAKAIPLREVKFDNVINFLEWHIIYRFRVPR